MRISGITLPDNKHIAYSLTAIYGIGLSRAKKICAAANVDPTTKTATLTAEVENELRKQIEIYKIEGDLKREISGNIKRLKDIGAYRGTRHNKRLPVHGQRTKTNSRTVRGNVRRTMGSGRRKLEKT
jgi:small subunit ribosomal protein S13